MRKVTVETLRELNRQIAEVLSFSISSDYVQNILEDTDENGEHKLIDCIADNVLETSAWEDEGYWNEDDIRLAIGRELSERLNPYSM